MTEEITRQAFVDLPLRLPATHQSLSGPGAPELCCLAAAVRPGDFYTEWPARRRYINAGPAGEPKWQEIRRPDGAAWPYLPDIIIEGDPRGAPADMAGPQGEA